MEDQLILVDVQDKETGRCGKLEAHEKALLHRAFSVFIFRRVLVDNPDGTRTFENQLLIQKRARDKYHSGGLWANSCCSHPRYGETLEEAVARRLEEETGIKASECKTLKGETGLEEKGAFIYKAEFDNGLTEYEFDHVFCGWIEDSTRGSWPGRNPEEAEDMVFTEVEGVMKDVLLNTKKYSAWFMPALMIAVEGTEFESRNRNESDRLIY